MEKQKPITEMTLEVCGVKISQKNFIHNGITGLSQEFRFFSYDFFAVIVDNTDLFYKTLQKEMKFDDEKMAYVEAIIHSFCYLAFDFEKTSKGSFEGKISNFFSKKRIRKLDLDTIFYNSSFNPTILSDKKYSDAEKIRLVQEIKGKLIDDYYIKTNRSRLNHNQFKKTLDFAIYKEFPEDLIDVPEIHIKYFNQLLEYIREKELEIIPEGGLLGYTGFEEIREKHIKPLVEAPINNPNIDFILARIDKIGSQIGTELEFILDSDPTTDVHNKENFVSDNSNYCVEIDDILYSLIQEIKKAKKTSKSETKINFFDQKIEEIVNILFSPISYEHKMGILLEIRFLFSDKSGFFQKFTIYLELQIAQYYNIFSKFVLKNLTEQEKLTKAERKLFLAYNYALPGLLRKIVRFEPVIINYFNFSNTSLTYFIDTFIVDRDKLLESAGFFAFLKEYLKYSFDMYLNFYQFWYFLITDEDTNLKADKQFRKRKTSLRISDNSYDNDFINTDEILFTKNESPQELLNEISDGVEQENNSPNPDNKSIDVEFDAITVKPKISSNIYGKKERLGQESAFEIDDILKKTLDLHEYKIISGVFFGKNSQESMSQEFGFSAQKISDIMKSAKKKLRKCDLLYEYSGFVFDLDN